MIDDRPRVLQSRGEGSLTLQWDEALAASDLLCQLVHASDLPREADRLRLIYGIVRAFGSQRTQELLQVGCRLGHADTMYLGDLLSRWLETNTQGHEHPVDSDCRITDEHLAQVASFLQGCEGILEPIDEPPADDDEQAVS
jgi:hypothetical protein